MKSPVLATVELSVSSSVCPSVTHWHCVKTTLAKITKSSPTDSPRTPVFATKTSSRNSKRFIPSDGVKWEWAMSSETLEIRPTLLYSDMQSVVDFSVIPKCVTLNELEWLFRVKFCFRAGLSGLQPTHCQRRKSSAGTLNSFWQYKVYADIRAGSLEKRHQRAVGSRVNAHPEHLFLAFENNFVKLKTDRRILQELSYSLGTII